MSDWRQVPLDQVVGLKRGFDLPEPERRPGAYPVLGSSGISGWHDQGPVEGPGVTIGRSGASIGVATYYEGDYWPLNTTLFVEDFKGNNHRYIYYLLDSIDFASFDSGSAQPSLNRNYIAGIRLSIPEEREQAAIVSLLGALDDKIAVNDRIAACCHEIADLHYQGAAEKGQEIPLSQVIDPILGGTPDRSVADYWGDGNPWASAKDVTGAPFGIIVSTEEEITNYAVIQTKAKPVPKGSVILTARGTVGAVARVGQPTSFNQSCYAFTPGNFPPAVLYLTIKRAAQRMLTVAHGTVFSTVTKKTFDHIYTPMVSHSELQILESQLAPLLDTVECRVRESLSLAELRDTLLPKLMSGEIRVRDAEKVVEEVT